MYMQNVDFSLKRNFHISFELASKLINTVNEFWKLYQCNFEEYCLQWNIGNVGMKSLKYYEIQYYCEINSVFQRHIYNMVVLKLYLSFLELQSNVFQSRNILYLLDISHLLSSLPKIDNIMWKLSFSISLCPVGKNFLIIISSRTHARSAEAGKKTNCISSDIDYN